MKKNISVRGAAVMKRQNVQRFNHFFSTTLREKPFSTLFDFMFFVFRST